MTELVLDISTVGGVESMHMDAFDLSFLGRKKVVRQTDILHNPDTDKWDIHYLEGGTSWTRSELHGFDTYEAARSFEVAWLNACRLSGASPSSDKGEAYARAVKSTHLA